MQKTEIPDVFHTGASTKWAHKKTNKRDTLDYGCPISAMPVFRIGILPVPLENMREHIVLKCLHSLQVILATTV